MVLTHAEQLLLELGITEPNEIDLEAIAYHVGARVRFCKLDGCEAHIVGAGDKAIITVNDRSSYRRSRFSIAHELGHWKYHRGKKLVCRVEDIQPRSALSAERLADGFAADLLMPGYILQPLARQHPKLNFKSVLELADRFMTSREAMAIRLVERGHAPAVLVCHGQNGRKWFARGPDVPEKWFPRDTLDAQSHAFSILFGKAPDDPHPRRIGADAWFDRWEASGFDVQEQTIRILPDRILTIVALTDQRMLKEDDTRGPARFR
jgi:Zn-dependent peptidase ImmA (M78 family)